MLIFGVFYSGNNCDKVTRLAEYGFLVDILVEAFVFWKALLVVFDFGILLLKSIFFILSSSADNSKLSF